MKQAAQTSLGFAAPDVINLLDRLLPFDDADLSQLKITATAKPKASPARMIEQSSTSVAEYIAALHDVASDKNAFEQLLGKLRTDKTLKVQDLKAIANGYRNVSGTYKSKSDTLNAITQAWLALDKSKSRLSRIRDIF
jgi:ribosomal protein L16 Arg81 hydroxylase